MNRENDNGEDFWGGKSDWTSEQDRPTTQHERFDAAAHWANEADAKAQGPAARLRRSLSGLLSSGSDATREHGITRPDAADAAHATTPARGVSADMFDDLDDDDFAYDDTAGWTTTTSATTASSASTAAATSTAGSNVAPFDDTYEDDWDAEFAPAPLDARHERRSASIDPLLVRVGAVAVVGALLVPLLLNTGGDDIDRLVGSAASTEAVESVITLLPQTTAAAPADATSAQLDPNDLQPAVPVNEPVAVPTAATVVPSVTVAAEASAGASTASDAPTSTAAQSAALDTKAADEPASADQPAAADEPATRVERNCAIDYTVVAGDFWIRLAEAAGVDLDELLEANGASASTPLYPGAEICLPAGATTPAPPTTTVTTQAPTTTAAPTTTQAPSTTVAPTTQPPTTSPPGPEDIKQIIRDVWPDELEERALEIAYRESRFVPTAKNFCCYGVFQIYWSVHRSWLDDIGITNDQQLYDPETNARAAYALYQRAGGWGPWAL